MIDSNEIEAMPTLNPLADLLFSIAAVFMLAVLLLFPLARGSGPRSATQADAPHQRRFQLNGQPVTAFLATSGGMFVPGMGAVIAQASIPDDPALRSSLLAVREGGGAFLLLVDPGGEETAFQFEVVMAATGLTSLLQIRLAAPCAARSNLASCVVQP